ncbi:MAG TPA: TonB-dependent receptor [Blastocatellia bacterium]|nr:TonB-dependent receptor [Blastocatellia bacterium]
MQAKKYLFGILALILICGFSAPGFTQANGSLRGTVTLETSGKPVHNVAVTIIQLKLSTDTDDNGAYEFKNVPPGTYDVVAHLDRVPDVVQTIQVSAGASVTADFQMRLRVVGEQVTVTGSGGEQTSFNSIQSVTSLTAVELAEKNPQSLGEALDHELGISKRTFGPGTSRPVIRGFDGDRVLVLEDGNRIGSLGFQSGDHAEPVDVLNLEKLEVVKGPATLLYGSSAIGGVVNAITGHESAHPGLRGYITAIGSSNNYQGGGSAGLEYGTKSWLIWANGGGQRAGDYETPLGRITNSYTREGNGSGGFGYYPGTKFLSVDYAFDRRRYGIPFNPSETDPEVVFLNPRRQSIRLNGGLRDIGKFIDAAQFSLQYNDYRHNEVNFFTDEINTAFKNKTFNYRGVFDERKSARWSGSFGLWGLHRDYTSSGEEALAPPTRQNAFAIFALEKLGFERLSFQFGGRFEHNGYNPDQALTRLTPDRSFDGFSGAIGMRVPTWRGGAFVANYSHSYRAPSLEELYNLGPHGGNATFEIGDPNLQSEHSDGIDLSLRHSANRLRAELNYFYYHIKDFIFLAPTGQIDDESGLLIADYAQGASRYTGAEARLDVGLRPNLWLISSLDYVNAKLIDNGTPIPRIPPLRGRVGFEAIYKGFRFAPEAIIARDQDHLFPTETRTAGYTLFNANVSYTFAQQHYAQIISVTAFNIGDRLYRNHLSFIKDFAPEIGRGVRLTYTVRFF